MKNWKKCIMLQLEKTLFKGKIKLKRESRYQFITNAHIRPVMSSLPVPNTRMPGVMHSISIFLRRKGHS